MGLSTSNLNDYLVLETGELLWALDSIFFVSAQLLDHTDRQAKLATFGAAPAVDFVLLGQG